ncbi:MAG TPA: TerB family tellurite resistance protein [Rhizomicrobium sp.]|nr:TerB family tellurite resistance protein [Rhizomicrobium sp.]
MSLGLLVGRFGAFVRDQHDAIAAAPTAQIEEPLAHERQMIAHHMIPLALLARSDGNSDVAEQAAMLDHALTVLRMKGETVPDAGRAALKTYIAALRPSLVQLDPALKRLEHEPPETIAALLDAAKKVMMADGATDEAETHLLEEMQKDLAKA